MDPNLFHLDYERLFEVLLTIVVFAFLIERALSVLFEWRHFIRWNTVKEKPGNKQGDPSASNDGSGSKPAAETESKATKKEKKGKKKADKDIGVSPANKKPRSKGLKEVISLICSVAVCIYWDFDALSIIFVSQSENQMLGYVITGAVIAGGSKASIRLFHDLAKTMSNAEAERKGIEQKIGKC